MPELPEVENLRRGLERTIVGQKIKKVIIHKPKLVSGKGNQRVASQDKKTKFVHGVLGERFLRVDRRAKNLIFILSHDKVLLGHLKMSGQFAYLGREVKNKVIGGHPIELSEHKLPNKHSHIIFELERGTLYYNDTRMFGYLLYYKDKDSFEKANHFVLYGLEPAAKEFTLKYLLENLRKKKGKIKAVLMDQRVVVGLGNIYADESLFEARIRPDRRASSLSESEIIKLHPAIKRIVNRAIKTGGSSIATYRLLDQSRGNYAREHKVYGKSGQNCPRCRTPLSKMLIQSRTTVYCSVCQK